MINRPINIPGRRKVITKNMILEAQKHTKSNMAAAKWMNVCYTTYKKWAKYYKVFEQHKNQYGVGIKSKNLDGSGMFNHSGFFLENQLKQEPVRLLQRWDK